MESFSVEVNGITKDEYITASHENFRRLYTTLPICMLVICGVIVVASGNYSIKSIAWPFVIYFLVVIAAEIIIRRGYNDQLSSFGPLIYEFNDTQWQVSAGEEHHAFNWEATPTLRIKKNAVFLYNDEVNSNLVPARLLSDEEIKSIKSWFSESREKAKIYQKNLYHLEAEKFKSRHKNDTFMGRGPMWGPFRGRKK
ncbi:MAG: hypothetical protein K6G40_08890 [Eubacterium sp.]|nr:hypothetical protein [Eubacterium sp.]